ncbi:hypothetical protein HYY69_00875 [Candidatus Woesearchaeota archaeon]|nr:hypothetical protein [Candidatus Woesearchaeota archaeon]
MKANSDVAYLMIGAINSGNPIAPKTRKPSSQKIRTMKSELQLIKLKIEGLRYFVTNW